MSPCRPGVQDNRDEAGFMEGIHSAVEPPVAVNSLAAALAGIWGRNSRGGAGDGPDKQPVPSPSRNESHSRAAPHWPTRQMHRRNELHQ
jgi:hypothetical protein